MASEPLANTHHAAIPDLQSKVWQEVRPVFRNSVAPKVEDDELRSAVSLLFELLNHGACDDTQGNVGRQVVAELDRLFAGDDLGRAEDRFEPFCKLLLRFIDPNRFEGLAQNLKGKIQGADILKSLNLITQAEIKALKDWDWREAALPSGIPAVSPFLEHVIRTLKFRNKAVDHNAPKLGMSERFLALRSFCVVLVWAVIKSGPQIRSALLRARFSDYLHKLRDVEDFAPIAKTCVELSARSCSSEEYRISNPLMPLAEAPSGGEEIEVSKLPETNRVTVIEAEAGAGKTTMLQFLAWREAGRLLDDTSHDARVPVLVGLRHLNHCRQTIASAVEQNLACIPPEIVPWDRVLLLVDGLNEVAAEVRSSFTDEINCLLGDHQELRLVVTGRLNSFRGEFPGAAIMQMQPLNDRRLFELFRKVLQDDTKAASIVASILQTAGLSSLAQIPFYAARLAGLAQSGGIPNLTSPATIVRRCVRDFVKREEGQASTRVSRTDWETKELILARLAFDTKCAGEDEFSRMRARTILGNAKARVSPSLDVSKFLEEARDNHLLVRAKNDALTFGHDLYHDYFAACKLEADEQLQKSLGVDLALAHFAEQRWQECIRFFASLTGSSRILIERGADKHPYLAFRLLRDARLDGSDLREKIADAAYCALTCDLRNSTKVALAKECMPILAVLDRPDLLAQAIIKQRQILEPIGLWKLTGTPREEEERRIQEAMVPLGHGLLSVMRVGTIEQHIGQEGRFCEASRAAIQALKQIEAAHTLITILAYWTGKTFDASSLVPGAIVEALAELGADSILFTQSSGDREFVANKNRNVVQWLEKACEAGVSVAWPVYGRCLRLALNRDYPGVEFEPQKALKWLRKAHDENVAGGSLELALLLIEEPSLATEIGEGDRLLRDLASVSEDARCELGKLLMSGDGLARDESAGFEILLTLAEAKHSSALSEVMTLWIRWLVWDLAPRLQLPSWAEPYKDRINQLTGSTESKA